MLRRSLFIGLFVYWIIGLFSPKASAATMTNSSYTIDNQDVQIQPFKNDLSKPKNQFQKPIASGDNFTVTTSNPDPFTISISQESINFGKLQATNPVLRNVTVGLTSSRGFQLLAGEDHPLQTTTNATLPDTTCDNGSCSEFTAAVWINPLTYGFGYRTNTMETDTYKQFADISKNEVLQAILQGVGAQNLEAKITYRINTSGTQTIGSYTNTISYIATPDY